MKEYVNDSSQDERKTMLKNDRQARTYFERAQESIGDELGGRYRPLTKPSVEAVPSVPRQPPNSPWHSDPTGPEPSLGYSFNDMAPVGTPSEIAASIAAELAKGVARAPDALPSHEPLKRRV